MRKLFKFSFHKRKLNAETTYHISSYSCRGNYSFLNSSSEETIQGRKLYEEIQYLKKVKWKLKFDHKCRANIFALHFFKISLAFFVIVQKANQWEKDFSKVEVPFKSLWYGSDTYYLPQSKVDVLFRTLFEICLASKTGKSLIFDGFEI